MAAVIAALILLACLGLSFLPLLLPASAEESASPEHDPRPHLEIERRRLLGEIREIDMDLTMGKVNEKDHAVLRAGLEQQALTVLSRLGELEGGEEE